MTDSITHFITVSVPLYGLLIAVAGILTGIVIGCYLHSRIEIVHREPVIPEDE